MALSAVQRNASHFIMHLRSLNVHLTKMLSAKNSSAVNSMPFYTLPRNLQVDQHRLLRALHRLEQAHLLTKEQMLMFLCHLLNTLVSMHLHSSP